MGRQVFMVNYVSRPNAMFEHEVRHLDIQCRTSRGRWYCQDAFKYNNTYTDWTKVPLQTYKVTRSLTEMMYAAECFMIAVMGLDKTVVKIGPLLQGSLPVK